MTAIDFFIILGITYFIFWLLVGLAVIMGVIYLYKKFKRMEEEAVKKSALVALGWTAMNKLPLKRVAPVIALLPLFLKIFKKLFSKNRQ